LPASSFLENANRVFQSQGGYDLKQASVTDKIKKSKTPTLFIHGEEDKLISVEDVYVLFDACAAPVKKLLIIRGAGHVQSSLANPDFYFETVFAFLSPYMVGNQ
jgi:fermentation-respiration switch protein FrsA (DUF1100 family)